MQAASLMAPQTLNMYTYCGNDPVNYTDPSGLFIGQFFRWLGRVLLGLSRSRVARRIAIKFVVNFALSGGNFGVAIRSILPDILQSTGIFPDPRSTAPWYPGSRLPISLGTSTLSKYIILNYYSRLDDLTKNPEVLKIFYCLLSAAGWLLNRDDKTEKAAWIVQKDDGKQEGVRWPWSAEAGQESWKGDRPKGYVAIAHTHPPTASPRPSTTGGNTGRGDQGTADTVKVPVYVITRNAIWKAVPGAKKPQAVVEGDWWKTFRKEKTKCP